LEGDLFNRIVTQPVRFPEAVAMPDSSRALISALLQKRPEHRPTADDIKAHPFFVSTMRINWEALLRKELSPPVKPNVDLSNFPQKHRDAPTESFVEQSPTLPLGEHNDFFFHATDAGD